MVTRKESLTMVYRVKMIRGEKTMFLVMYKGAGDGSARWRPSCVKKGLVLGLSSIRGYLRE